MIMIIGAEAVPEEVTIAVGERVSFMNHDATAYTVAGDRAPSSSDCPELNVVGMLAPGAVRTTEPFMAAKTCGFHVSRGDAALLAGRIVVR
jgi:plastocyanin